MDAAFGDERTWVGGPITESLDHVQSLALESPEGALTHEVIIPFTKQPTQSPRGDITSLTQRMLGRAAPPRRVPGSRWLYAKIYTGVTLADALVVSLIKELEHRWCASGKVDRCFFVRYADPDFHLRVRARGDPRMLLKEVLPAIRSCLEQRRDLWWRFQLDQYEPEVERYGGWEGMDCAERLFTSDSAFATRVLEIEHRLHRGAADRWIVGLAAIDRLLDDFGLPGEDKLAIVSGAHRRWGEDIGAGKHEYRQVARTRRAFRSDVQAALSGNHPFIARLGPALRARSAACAYIAAELRRLSSTGSLAAPLVSLMASYVHMHLNRLLRSQPREHEFVVLGLLEGAYRGRLARAEQGRPASDQVPDRVRHEAVEVAWRAEHRPIPGRSA